MTTINLRITVPLDKQELRALVAMSEVECRPPREQLRFLLRKEAERLGLLLDGSPISTQASQGSLVTVEEVGSHE